MVEEQIESISASSFPSLDTGEWPTAVPQKGQISYTSTKIYIDVYGENGSFEGYILWKIETNDS